MSKSLKSLSRALELSEGYLKGLVKGNKKGKDDIVTMNTANACKAVARFTGYHSVESAKKAITANINMLYIPSNVLADRIEKIIPKYGKVKGAILTKAVTALRANNFSEFNKLVSSNKDLKKFKRKCAKNLKKEAIDKLRSADKSNKATAKAILTSMKAPNGSKIVVPPDKLEKEIAKRLKRYGAVASLFWQSAKALNPKIKGDKLSKEKKKKHKATNGANFKTNITKDSASATVQHLGEKVNSKFKQKLDKRIREQETFWAKQAEKQILAAKYLDKLIESTN